MRSDCITNDEMTRNANLPGLLKINYPVRIFSLVAKSERLTLSPQIYGELIKTNRKSLHLLRKFMHLVKQDDGLKTRCRPVKIKELSYSGHI
jgi:hypothetical protein